MYQILIFFVIVLYVWKFKVFKKKKYPPELSGKLPLLGHALRFCSNKLGAVDLVKSLTKECKEKGGIVTLYFGKDLFYVVSNPEDCLKISNLCVNKNKYYYIAKPFLGEGVQVASALIWKKKRKILNLALNNNTLNEFIFIFNKKSRKLVDIFAKHVFKVPFDHYDILKSTFLESICLTSYGISVEKYKKLYDNYLKETAEILEIFYERFSRFWLHNDFIYNFTRLKKLQDQAMESINLFNRTMLQERKSILKMRNNTSDKHEPEFRPFMDIILESYLETEDLTDEDIMYETNNLVGAGFDTSATVATFILTLLGSHQNVQEKVLAEITEVIGNTDRDVNKDDLPKLVYLEAVLRETIRLYPLAPIIGRDVERDIHLKNYTLNAGSNCILLFWALHRHPVWGLDAEQFRPERWLEKDSLPNLHSTYAGFSLGRRSCVGKTYAIMNIKIALVHLLRNYKIKSDINKMTLKIDVLLRPDSGHEIHIERRINYNNEDNNSIIIRQ